MSRAGCINRAESPSGIGIGALGKLIHSSPAWKLKTCIDAMKVRPVDLSWLAQTTGVRFASDELVELAAECLEKIHNGNEAG